MIVSGERRAQMNEFVYSRRLLLLHLGITTFFVFAFLSSTLIAWTAQFYAILDIPLHRYLGTQFASAELSTKFDGQIQINIPSYRSHQDMHKETDEKVMLFFSVKHASTARLHEEHVCYHAHLPSAG